MTDISYPYVIGNEPLAFIVQFAEGRKLTLEKRWVVTNLRQGATERWVLVDPEEE